MSTEWRTWTWNYSLLCAFQLHCSSELNCVKHSPQIVGRGGSAGRGLPTALWESWCLSLDSWRQFTLFVSPLERLMDGLHDIPYWFYDKWITWLCYGKLYTVSKGRRASVRSSAPSLFFVFFSILVDFFSLFLPQFILWSYSYRALASLISLDSITSLACFVHNLLKSLYLKVYKAAFRPLGGSSLWIWEPNSLTEMFTCCTSLNVSTWLSGCVLCLV